MTIRHFLLGFDKATGAVHEEWAIPTVCEAAVARILRAGANRLAEIDPRELTPRQAESIGKVIRQQIDAGTHDYFIQAFIEAPIAAARQSEAAE